MNELTIINSFNIEKYCFSYSHSMGELKTFRNPCIGYIKKGKAEFLCRGKKHSAFAGDVVYIAKETKYYSVWNGSPEIEFYSVNFSFSNPTDKIDYKFQLLENYPVEMFDEIYENYNNNPMKSAGIFYILLSELYNKLQRGIASSTEKAVEKAIKYIEENYNTNYDISYLATLCGFSESRFFALFKLATGCAPVYYKHHVLIQHAIEMLAYTNYSIEQISERLNFSSPRYFRRVFKKITGKTPKEIRC